MADESGHDERMMMQVIGIAVTAIAAIGTIWTMRRRRRRADASSGADAGGDGQAKSGAEIRRSRGSSGSRQSTLRASRIKANGGQWPPKRSRSRNNSTASGLLAVDSADASSGTKKAARTPRRNGDRSVKSIAGAYDKKQEHANASPSVRSKSSTLQAARLASHKRKASTSRSPRKNKSATLPPNTKASTQKSTVTRQTERTAKLPTVAPSSRSTAKASQSNGEGAVTSDTPSVSSRRTSRRSSSRSSTSATSSVRKVKAPTIHTARKAKLPTTEASTSSETQATPPSGAATAAATSAISVDTSRRTIQIATAKTTPESTRKERTPNSVATHPSLLNATPKVRAVSDTLSTRTHTHTTTSRPRPSVTRTAKLPPQTQPSPNAAGPKSSSCTLPKSRTVVHVAPSTRDVKPSSPDARKSRASNSRSSSAVAEVVQEVDRHISPSSHASTAVNVNSVISGLVTATNVDLETSVSISKSDTVKPRDPSPSPSPSSHTDIIATASSTTSRPVLKRAQTNSIRCHLCLAKIDGVNDESTSCSFEGKWFHSGCFQCQRCGLSLSSETCELFELIGPLCTEHASALKNSKKKLRNAARAIGAFKMMSPTHVDAEAEVEASSLSKSKPTHCDADAEPEGDSSSKPKPTPLVIDNDTNAVQECSVADADGVQEYSIADADADADADGDDAEDDLNSLFDDIMATHIEENDGSGSDDELRNGVSHTPDADIESTSDTASHSHRLCRESELPFTPSQRRQITEESEKFFSEEMFCMRSPRTQDHAPKLRCFRCSDHRKERVSVDTSQRLISLGYPPKVEFCSDGECFACLKCSESLHTVLQQRGMKAVSVSPFGAVCTSCVTISTERGEE